MPSTKDIQDFFPEPSKVIINQLWSAIPADRRQALIASFKGLPFDRNPTKALMDLAIIHSKAFLGKRKRAAIIGPANVGKSTLYNQFIRNDQDKAAVSPIPGTTRVNQEADAGIFNMVDTPGADAVGPVGEQERERALEAARSANFLIIVFDALQGIKQTEQELYHSLLELKKPFVIALNKIDLAGKLEDEIIQRTALNLGVEKEQIIPVSALKGSGISDITMAIIAADPAMTLALANAMPMYRNKIAWRTITTSASLSAAIALSPLPVIDFVPLIANQVGMVITIARIYQYKITPARARELVGTFGLGMLGRTLFQQLSKFASVPGWLLSSAIATSMTVVMGYAAIEWFEKGERVNSERFNELSKELSQSMLERFKQVFKKKPSKKKLKETVIELVSEPPITASKKDD
ncbi:MAG TPA: GTP-binding protein [Chloroflexi bacterium]|nr:GTP-binding protein [Chloroflexota bacterium]